MQTKKCKRFIVYFPHTHTQINTFHGFFKCRAAKNNKHYSNISYATYMYVYLYIA